MKSTVGRNVMLIYICAVVILLVFLPNLIDFKAGFGHQLEHFLLFAAAAVFAYAVEKLRQAAIRRQPQEELTNQK
ncbi:hypothetical protein [Alicyclobacillus fodiniaquatilis]|jgi:hypothetical protein|uniref:Uncharacterized protein n=1 Tax=Alicyclobacillus fodiniaquatilis TaxID=1661150 RepID=A0ABW4JK11_9BACL